VKKKERMKKSEKVTKMVVANNLKLKTLIAQERMGERRDYYNYNTTTITMLIIL
jgi:transcriptional regulator of met regulon